MFRDMGPWHFEVSLSVENNFLANATVRAVVFDLGAAFINFQVYVLSCPGSFLYAFDFFMLFGHSLLNILVIVSTVPDYKCQQHWKRAEN